MFNIRSAVTLLILTMFLLPGCQSPAVTPTAQPTPAAQPSPTTQPTASVPDTRTTLRIKAGVTTNYTDPDGVVWLADQGFDGGDTVERDPDAPIVTNTKDPAMYHTERFSMTGYTFTVPNGKYTVKLHFAETFDGITGPGQRVFSFNVQGHEVKDFDLYVKAGGPSRLHRNNRCRCYKRQPQHHLHPQRREPRDQRHRNHPRLKNQPP